MGLCGGGTLRVARIVIGENPSGSRSGAIAIPQDRQNRIKRCGVRARQLDYLHVMIWLLVAVSSYAQKSYGRATMRTKKRFAASGGWGYINFNHQEPKAPTAKVTDCGNACHLGGAKKD